MRRIFTFSFFAAALLVASFNSFGQVCHLSTSNPLSPAIPGVPGYGTSFNITTAEGFSGNRTPINVWPENTANTTLISPIFFYSTAQNATYFKVHLTPDGNNKPMDITSYSISVKYGSGAGTVQTCTSPAGSTTIPGIAAGTDFYFWMTGISIPANTSFQITLTLSLSTSSGSTHNETASAFQSNATFNAQGALPVKFQTLEATPSNNAVALKWMVASEEHLSGYNVEKSIDGKSFSKIGFVSASNQPSYSFVDSKSGGTAYYRIRSVDLDGRFGFSTIALVKSGQSLTVLNAFPSPFVSSFNLDHGTAAAGSLITISAEDGRTIKTIIPTVGSQRTPVDLSAAKAGMYLVRFKNTSGQVE